MKRRLLILTMLLATTLCFATPVKDLFPHMNDSSYERLMNGDVIASVLTPETSFTVFTDIESMGTKYEYTSDETMQSIAPEGSESEKIINKTGNSIKQGFYAETVAVLPYPQKMKEMDEAQKQNYLFNLTTKLSTLKGIEYFSHTAGDKTIALFTDAYAIEGKNTPNKPIKDPSFDTAPADFSCYAMIKDSRFGKNVYQVSYQTNQSEIFMDIRNTAKIRFFILPCLDKEALDMYIDVIQADDGIILYTMAKTDSKLPDVKIGSFSVDIPSAFVKRIIALGKWFAGNLNE